MLNKKNFKEELKVAYDTDAKRRDEAEGKRDQWKLELRQYFVDLLKKENKKSVLELGAGAGLDSLFFKKNGFEVLATDLSPEMIKMCQKRGLEATAFDLYDLEKLNKKFDAIFSLNVLLHVPRKDIEKVLEGIYNTLNDNGIFFYGVYGGIEEEKTIIDKYKMGLPRFFSFLSDETILELVKTKFDVIKFETIDVEGKQPGFHFQSLFLRKK
jgi:cyclopropane fatty-acyl-phospholipid synthase-like methyltransferase